MILEGDEGVLLVHGQQLVIVRKGGVVQQHLLRLRTKDDCCACAKKIIAAPALKRSLLRMR
jgi:hypothetical protein